MTSISTNNIPSSLSKDKQKKDQYLTPQNNKKIYLKKKDVNINKPNKQKVLETYLKEFNENFQDILLEPKEQFLKNITTEGNLILNEVFQDLSIENKILREYQKYALDKLDEEYEKNYQLLNKEWENYIKNPKKYNYLTHIRKHCIKTNNEAYHSCENDKAKLIEIYDKISNEVSHVICTECKECYKSNSILLLCYNCKIEYYSCILPKDSNINILPATWEKYHCGGMINETMKCIKCQNVLYFNLNERYLVCLNKSCKFRARPESMIWNCIFCKKEFKSNAKIYNPMEMFKIKRAIRKAFLFKEPAYPSELPCCKSSPEQLFFYHKDECKGQLFKGILNKKEIIVCSKCRAMNFTDKFIWTCPLCQKRFRNYKKVWGNLFKKKEYLIENSDRKSNNRYNNIYDVNDDNFNLNGHRLTISSNISRDNILNLLNDSNKNDGKKNKKQYKTLLDVIEKRNSKKDINIYLNINKSKNDLKASSSNCLYKISDNFKQDKNDIDNEKEDNELKLIYLSNEDPLSRNYIKKNNNFSKSIDDENVLSLNNHLKDSGTTKTNSRKSGENKDDFDKINLLDNLNNNYKKQDSLSSIGELASVGSLTSTQIHNILVNPEKLETIIKEGKIPEFDTDDYIYLDPIGEGSYGKIYLVQNSYNKTKYAIKKIICHDLKEVKQIQKEIELVYSKSHPNIMKIIKVQYKALDITTYSIYVLMELAFSDWNKEIKRRAKKKLLYKENEIIDILNQIVDALLYLENEGIAHRDIKPQNILLFQNNVFKVADFGEAKKLNDISQECTLRGSELYMSPVLYNGLKLCQKDVVHNAFKSDVFSLSFCLIYALSLNLSILNEIREIDNMNQICNIIQRNFKRYYSQDLIILILKMIDLNENERFSFLDIKNYLNEKYN